jgi:hypothetical protein
MCEDKDLLVSYLYGECGPADRERFERHLTVCPSCVAELEGLRGARDRLTAWNPPDVPLGFEIVRRESGSRTRRFWSGVPAWAAVAAAGLLVVAGAAALANLEIGYGPNGLVVRTGWDARPAAGASAEDWRPELAALEGRLRRELETQPVMTPAAAPRVPDAEIVRQLRSLIEESERRQQRELAFRLAQVVQDIDRQRQVDLIRIQRGLGQLDVATGVEAARTREALNYLIRVTQRPPQ